jgi:hypothetical protein
MLSKTGHVPLDSVGRENGTAVDGERQRRFSVGRFVSGGAQRNKMFFKMIFGSGACCTLPGPSTLCDWAAIWTFTTHLRRAGPEFREFIFIDTDVAQPRWMRLCVLYYVLLGMRSRLPLVTCDSEVLERFTGKRTRTQTPHRTVAGAEGRFTAAALGHLTSPTLLASWRTQTPEVIVCGDALPGHITNPLESG